MTRSNVLFALIAASGALAPSLAQADALDVCAKEPQDSARLACFDREIAARHPATAPPAQPAPPAQAVHPASASASASAAQPAPASTLPDPNIGLEGTQLRQALKAQGADPGAPVAFVARVARVRQISKEDFAFELDNGQVWQPTESIFGVYIKAQDPITISPGVLGSFFLTTQHKERVRVKRIR